MCTLEHTSAGGLEWLFSSSLYYHQFVCGNCKMLLMLNPDRMKQSRSCCFFFPAAVVYTVVNESSKGSYFLLQPQITDSCLACDPL